MKKLLLLLLIISGISATSSAGFLMGAFGKIMFLGKIKTELKDNRYITTCDSTFVIHEQHDGNRHYRTFLNVELSTVKGYYPSLGLDFRIIGPQAESIVPICLFAVNNYDKEYFTTPITLRFHDGSSIQINKAIFQNCTKKIFLTDSSPQAIAFYIFLPLDQTNIYSLRNKAIKSITVKNAVINFNNLTDSDYIFKHLLESYEETSHDNLGGKNTSQP